MELTEKLRIKDNVRIYRRQKGETEWKLAQTAENVVANFGIQRYLDLAAGSPTGLGSIARFMVGAGGRETLDANGSATLTAGSVLGFGNNTRNRLAQTFYAATGALSRVVFRPATKAGTPTDDLIINLFNTSGAGDANPGSSVVPTGTALATQYLRNSDWLGWIGSEIVLNIRNVNLNTGSRYAVELRRSGTTLNDTDFYNVSVHSGTNVYTSGNLAEFSGTAWNVGGASRDAYFKAYYPTFDGAPIAKTVNTTGLTLPVYETAINSVSRANQRQTFVLTLNSTQANTGERISEASLSVTAGGSATHAVAFRDEVKDENTEMQLNWDVDLANL